MKALNIILIGISLSLFSGTVLAAELKCPVFAPPKIEISVSRPDDRIDTTKSLEQIRAAGKDRHVAPIVGAYLGALQYRIQIDDTVRETAPGHFCATPKYITLRLTLDRIIYIPREFADDPCLRSLTTDHESKHADADAEALSGARPALESAARNAVRRSTMEPVASRADAIAALAAEIQSDVNRALDDMAAVRKRLDARVDNPIEIEYLKTACTGRATSLAGDSMISQ